MAPIFLFLVFFAGLLVTFMAISLVQSALRRPPERSASRSSYDSDEPDEESPRPATDRMRRADGTRRAGKSRAARTRPELNLAGFADKEIFHADAPRPTQATPAGSSGPTLRTSAPDLSSPQILRSPQSLGPAQSLGATQSLYPVQSLPPTAAVIGAQESMATRPTPDNTTDSALTDFSRTLVDPDTTENF